MMSEADAVAIKLCVERHGIRRIAIRPRLGQPFVKTPEWQQLSDMFNDSHERGWLLYEQSSLLLEMLPGVCQLLKDRLKLKGIGGLRYVDILWSDLIAEIHNFNRGIKPQEKPIMQYNVKQVSRATLEEFAQHHLEGGQHTFRFFEKLQSEAAVKTQAELDKELCDYLRGHLGCGMTDDSPIPKEEQIHIRKLINRSRNAPAK